jgi:hypothetical protein
MGLKSLTVAVAGVGLCVGMGCKKEEAGAPPPAVAPKPAEPAQAMPPPGVPANQAAAPSGKGDVEGVVSFEGAVPEPMPIKPSSDKACAGMAAKDMSVAVENGKLANVHVRLLGTFADAAKPTAPIIIDQHQCTYLPRVQGAVEGQPISVKNSDGTMHNVHGYVSGKTIFNTAQPMGAPPLDKSIKSEGDGVVKLKCDVHPWMTGYVVFSKHPFFATSGADGKFSIRDVPAGTYEAEAWHEKLGTKKGSVTIEPGKPAKLDFSFSAKT